MVVFIFEVDLAELDEAVGELEPVVLQCLPQIIYFKALISKCNFPLNPYVRLFDGLCVGCWFKQI